MKQLRLIAFGQYGIGNARCRIFAFILLLLIRLSAFSQISNSHFKHITNEQGLSNTTINCIFQDSRGFLWFGTRDGLNRYDGKSIKVYRTQEKNPNSLSDNFINCIYEDSNHKLWIGTARGFNCYDPVSNKFTQYHNEDTSPKSNTSQVVTGICADVNSNTMWVTTQSLWLLSS